MIYHAKIKTKNHDSGLITIELSRESFEKIINSAVGADLYLDIPDRKDITPQQRKAIYAMLDDIGKHIGYDKNEMKNILKVKYTGVTGNKPFSLSNMKRNEATDFIHFLIDICLQMDIPIKLTTYKKIIKDDYIIKQLALHRSCVICGKRADLDHWNETVGMGNNRNKIDNTEYELMPLCRVHHTEKHKIGLKEFKEKYHLENGVYLTKQELKRVGW